MALVIPTILSRASSEGEGEELYQETSSRLLELAAANQGAFRSVVGGLSESQRAFMEEVLRAGQKTRKVEREEGREEPTIALRMNFGAN
jgi:hypothetical protein